MEPFLVDDLEWDSVELAIQQAEQSIEKSSNKNTQQSQQSLNRNIKPVILESIYSGNCKLCIYFKSPKLSVRYGYQNKQDHRVNLPISSIHPEIIEILSSFPGYEYNDKDNVFYINFDSVDQFEKRIQSFIPNKILQYKKVPVFVKEFYKRYKSKIPKRIDDVKIHFPYNLFSCDNNNQDLHPYVKIIKEKLPSDTLSQLKPFQIESIIFTLSRNGRILLADAPGLGKTIQSICISLVYKEYWPVLAVVPSSVRLMWASEFKKWIPELKDDDVNVIMTSKGKINGKINITSYGLIDKLKEEVIKSKVGVIICDESHLLKSWNSKRTKAIQPLIRSTKIAILLSGTPATSKPSELYSQLQSINSYLFGNFQIYADRYCDPKPRSVGGIDYSGSSNLIELNAILNESIMIRRTKDNVLNSLPTKRRHMELLDIPKDQKDLIKQLSSKLKSIKKQKDIANDLKKENWVRHSIIFELFRNTGRAKLPSVVSYLIDQLNDESNKILIFAHHQEIIEGIELSLIENHIECIRIDGKTPGYARQDLIDHFQNKESCRVAILSITAAGVGVTLTKANKVIFAELFWNPGLLTQAEDRAHRYGQEREVDIHYLIAKGTIDERVWDVLETKLSVLGETFDGKASSLNLDSKNVNSIDVSDNIESSSFIQYLIQKINDYEERIEESIERYDIRTKIRNEGREELEINEKKSQKRKTYDCSNENNLKITESKKPKYDTIDSKEDVDNLEILKINDNDLALKDSKEIESENHKKSSNIHAKEDISTKRSLKLSKFIFNS